MTLTQAQRLVLAIAPFYGFRPGSNAWSFAKLAAVADDGSVREIIASGEEIDLLIRGGLLLAEELPQPHREVAGPDDFLATLSHRYHVTAAGRAALAPEPRLDASSTY